MSPNVEKPVPTVVITGATAGVGRATARLFADHHAKIGLLARDAGRLAETKKDVEGRGGQALTFSLDVADAQKIEEAAQAIEEQFGPVDIWINNAMVTVVSEFKDMEPQEFKRVVEVCLLGCVNGTMAAVKRMWAHDKGKIVQVGSALAYRAIPLQSAYCASKHGIQGFTESLRSEIMHHKKNISITMVQMPALNTPQFNWCKTRMGRTPQPVPPIYQPEVAADAIYWAAYHHRREIIVGGRNWLIVWLNKFLPGFGDYYLAKTGYASQQTDKAVSPLRKDNLWQPVGGPFAARGDFDAQAKTSSKEFWMITHPGAVWSIILLVIVIVLIIILK